MRNVVALVGLTALIPLGAVTVALAQKPARQPDIHFTPTRYTIADAMLMLAEVTHDDVVYDLGSGDGRIVIRAAQKYGAHGVGVEIQPGLVEAARRAAVEAGVAEKVTFVQADLFAADISAATVVTLYLWPSVNERLESKLRRELRPGTRIVSHAFGIGSWRPEASVPVENGRDLLRWTVPRRPVRAPDVEFVPTPQPVADEMLRLAGAGPDDVVCDLGSGDGRIVILAAQKYGAKGVGVELDPSLVELSRKIAEEGEVADRARFVEGDLFTADVSAATVVTMFLSPAVNARLESTLRRLRPGTRIVSRQYGIGDWRPDQTVRAGDGSELFLFTVR
jgi:cyclopropane fatty-acyl-phospholipid synthase-like methyltransferase